ncbi:MAG: cytochrome c biogenesis protein ResB [Streptosporangiaceae bacterium]
MSVNTTRRSGEGPGEDLSTRPAEPRPPGFGVLAWLRWGWRHLTSMRTALILLFLLALAAVPGSVLPQRGRDASAVATFYQTHPGLAPVLDKLSLFDVFSAPWFGAIYTLLFVSLAGCVIPRSWRHAKTLRAKPPAAPRNLSRLPYHLSFETDVAPDEALAAARRVLRGRRFRLRTGSETVAAEKGYLRETGNLLFHLALLSMLFAFAAGALLGYQGRVLVTEGKGFANTLASYDTFDPGTVFSAGSLQPFSLRLLDFHASYVSTGQKRGQPRTFKAKVRYRATPASRQEPYTISVNHPLKVDGLRVFLMGHGYAPTFLVRDGKGHVAFKGAVPFLVENRSTFESTGVIKVPDARPTQLGFAAFFLPTAMTPPGGQPVSVWPAAKNPKVTLLGYKGDLGLGSGKPQSVYELDTSHLHKLNAKTLRPGQIMRLPGGVGSITFTGYKQWAGLQVTDSPAEGWALVSAVLAVLGLVLSLGVRRRRVWVRARRGEPGRTVVDVAGLTRGDAGGSFDEEIAALTERMRSSIQRSHKE